MNGTIYIDAHGTRVGHCDGRLTLKHSASGETSYPIEQIDRVFVCGHAHFSHDAISALLRRGIPAVFCGGRGGYRGALVGHQGHQVKRRMQQMDMVRDAGGSLTVARALVQAKLRGQRRLLNHWKAPGQHEISAELLASHASGTAEVLRGHEGAAARAFFDGLREHLADTPFVFERRQQHPPPDPVNAVLSLAYTLLLGKVEAGVIGAGLDPCVGFFHAIDNGRPALLMDLIEPLRPLADRFVARLLRGELKPEDFETRDNNCRLIDGRRGVFYRAWEKMLADRVVWRGESHACRRLIHRQALVLSAHLDGDARPLHFWHIDAH
jgi:CRISPR-associated protein Cas1